MYCFTAASDWFSRFLLPQVIFLNQVSLPQAAGDSYLTAASDGLPNLICLR
jgi:hypothetical protein